jgi:hypothetical protein
VTIAIYFCFLLLSNSSIQYRYGFSETVPEMRLSGHNALYKHAVKRAIWPQTRHAQFLRRFTSTSGDQPIDPDLYDDKPDPNSVAILGGGITGLATAYNLTKRLSDTKITIYEKNDRLGGWVDSEVIKVDNEEILFEWGPRTLRPALGDSGLATVDLVFNDYGIGDSLC